MKKLIGKNFSIDSRTIKPGEVFVAIKGENFDGHDFVDDALKKGASFAIVRKDFAKIDDRFIKVDCPLKTLQELARKHLEQFSKLKKVAITGSNGKTTTKEMLKASLEYAIGKEKVFASKGNFNNHIGLPLSAFLVNENHEVAIFEMGMNHEGEIATLCDIVNPQFGAITNISSAHEGNFTDGILGVKKAKGELFLSLHDKGVAIINLDDEHILDLSSKINFKKKITISSKQDSNISLLSAKNISLNKQQIRIKILDNIIDFSIPLLGEHHAFNACMAIGMAYALGADVKKAILGLENMPITKGRMEILRGINNSLVINDGYNANPMSMRTGIEAVSKIDAKRRLAVIGSMGELGLGGTRHHWSLGKEIAANFDMIFLCGDHAKDIFLGACENGFSPDKIFCFEHSHNIIEPLKKAINPGDLIFIKGSFIQNMQIIVDSLIKG